MTAALTSAEAAARRSSKTFRKMWPLALFAVNFAVASRTSARLASAICALKLRLLHEALECARGNVAIRGQPHGVGLVAWRRQRARLIGFCARDVMFCPVLSLLESDFWRENFTPRAGWQRKG